MKVKAYLVETEHSQTVFLDQAKATDYAVQHHGVIEPLVRLKDAEAAVSAAKVTTAPSGWSDWSGGENPPVLMSTKVLIKYRDGAVSTEGRVACLLDWRHGGDDNDILAYKLA